MKTLQRMAFGALLLWMTTTGTAAQQPSDGGAAQQLSEIPGEPLVPGWVFTPSVAFGLSYDDNPVLASTGDTAPNDSIMIVRPAAALSFTKKHARLSLGYRGSLMRYRTLDEFNAFDQGAYLDLRAQPTRRLKFFARDTFSKTPTTDAVQVAGLPFFRTGTRTNNLSAGSTIAATRTLDITGTYRFQWLEFSGNDQTVVELLQGGRSHGVGIDVRQRLNEHLRVGGSWDLQHALVGRTAEGFDIQNAEGVVEVQVAPTVVVEAGAGISYLSLPAPLGSQTGPAAHVQVRKQSEYAIFSLGASRSFVPAFGFGGSLRNQEITGSVRVPFSGRRGYVEGNAAWRDSEPVLLGEVGVRAFWLQSVVGYAVQRWLHVEAYYTGAYQDTTVVGGRVDRNRIGIQLVTSHPMRIE
jgi:hypothetical protein